MHKQALDILWGYEYRELQTHTNSFRKCIGSIENGARGLAFSSGLAATDCLMRGLKPGDEVIAMDDLYGELTDCLRKFIKIQVYYSICRHE
jgi:cystathionine beta-lyase/cystathionine gamma-synthase